MTKLLSPLVLALATVSLAGCELYFGGSGGGDDRWTYCAADGYYLCEGDDCEWAGPLCPSDPTYTCSDNADCAAGCYCSSEGVCEEAGFCGQDSDCPDGFYCEVDRASCVPSTCSTSADCEQGEYCSDNGSCQPSCTCTTDAEAQAAGYGYCDEARNTCEPPAEGGSCAAEVTCNTREPQCAVGEVPLVKDGCYTGACSAIDACDIAPACEAFQHEQDCLANSVTCGAVYTGINCTNGNGTACQAGDTGCTCESFRFDECRTRPQ
jgi:hypothetical protein